MIISFCVMALLQNNLMYQNILKENPALAFIGPLRWIPENSYFLFKTMLWITIVILISFLFIKKLIIKIDPEYIFLFLGIPLFFLILRTSPFPIIDVFTTNTTATLNLLKGLNPYSEKYIDIYQGSAGYAPSFGYFPGYLLFSIIALILGDIRIASIASLVGIGFLMFKKCDAGEHGKSIKLVVIAAILFGGSSFFIIEQAWIDPILAFAIFLAGSFLEQKKIFSAALACGIAITIKQYAFVAVVFFILFSLKNNGIDKTIKLVLALIGVSILILLPFLIWDFKSFYASTISGIANLPPRIDSLSIRSYILSRTNNDFSTISYICPLVILVLASKKIWRESDKMETLYLFTGFAYFLIFFFSSHSFANYYYLIYLFLLNSLFCSLKKNWKNNVEKAHLKCV